MTLTRCPDLSPADWIVTSTLPWQQLVTFGPSGFEAYARLRFLPDPAYDGQRESDVEEAGSDSDRLHTLLEVLAGQTRSPDECFFCVWDGFGDLSGGKGPKVVVPNRAYFLFHGPLATIGDWGAAEWWPGQSGLPMPDPAFVWPADRAWCVANDVDPHWAGIGATRGVVDKLIADPRLDVVAAEADAEQPAYQ